MSKTDQSIACLNYPRTDSSSLIQYLVLPKMTFSTLGTLLEDIYDFTKPIFYLDGFHYAPSALQCNPLAWISLLGR